MNITILYDSRNYTIIRDDITKNIWLYSYKKPIAYLDVKELKIRFSNQTKWTQTDKFHFANWKKFLGLKK